MDKLAFEGAGVGGGGDDVPLSTNGILIPAAGAVSSSQQPLASHCKTEKQLPGGGPAAAPFPPG